MIRSIAPTIALTLAMIAGFTLPAVSTAQDSTLTYQGQLRQDGEPFTGTANLDFRLFDQLVDGSEVAGPQLRPSWPVEDGLFQVELDFGSAAFDGGDRFLEVRVDGAPLSPRQRVTATPYALLAAGAAAGSIDGVSIDPTEIQLRVVGTCPAGEYVREVNQDGTVLCESAAGAGGTVTQVDTGAGLTGGPITDTGTISVASGGIGATQINPGQVQRRVTGTCPAGQSIRVVNQNGSVVCEVDDTGDATGLWSTSGNAPGSGAFLGTTNAEPLELRTANARSLRIEPSMETSGTPALPITTNSIGGSHANEVLPGVRGATIGGGGAPGGADPDESLADPNYITDNYATVGGGTANQAGDDAGDAFDSAFATVAGGFRNTASGSASTVGGGAANQATGSNSTVGGGGVNRAIGRDSTVGGGADNVATGRGGIVGGGDGNSASGDWSTVGGGETNVASNSHATLSGGQSNDATGAWSAIGGGRVNAATGQSSTVAGGQENVASGLRSTVGGGRENIASGDFSTVAGGQENVASSPRSTVGGGLLNTAGGAGSTVAGGNSNSVFRNNGFIGGGVSNTSSGLFASAVVGGEFNTASGSYSAVGGGVFNCAGGAGSWAGGTRAKVRPGTGSGAPGDGCASAPLSGDADGDNGTFVWADSQLINFVSTGPNQFLVRAAGGVGINTNAPLAPLTVATEDKWNPDVGNGYGDFLVGNANHGLAVGVADSGAGAGAVRVWPVGGNESIIFTTASSHPSRTLTLSDTRLVGVRRNPTNNALEVAGNASKSSAGSWLANSDARIKTDVEGIPGALDRLMQVRPVTFRYSQAYRDAHPDLDETRYYNVIAQEFARVFPDAVKGSGEFLPGRPQTPDNEILQVDTHPALITSIAAVQELAVRLEQAEARNASLKAEVASLRQQQAQELDDLRAEMAMLRERLAPRVAEAGVR